MKNLNFKRGDVEVSVISTKQADGSYSVEILATGDKTQVEAFMREVVSGTAHLDIPFNLTTGKEDGPAEPMQVSDLMGGN